MSAGSRSGVNCTRENDSPAADGDRAGGERLGHAGHVVEQHVPVGEQAGHDQLQRRPLADDRLADLVDDGAHQGGGIRGR